MPISLKVEGNMAPKDEFKLMYPPCIFTSLVKLIKIFDHEIGLEWGQNRRQQSRSQMLP